jgi:hypothetical protein
VQQCTGNYFLALVGSFLAIILVPRYSGIYHIC